MRCLVVEDDFDLSEVWRMALDDVGVEAEVVDCVMDAENALLARSFDVVITDLGLPDGDGSMVAGFTAMRHPQTPVLIVTGSRDYARGELFSLCPNVAGVFRKTEAIGDILAYVDHLGRRAQAAAH